MKRFLAIFLLFTFLTAHTAFREVLKLPVLVQHYWEHTKEDKEVTIFEFLVQHYTAGTHQDDDQSHHHHDKLPFKTIDGHFSSVVSIVYPLSFVISRNVLVMADWKVPAYNQQNYSNAYLNSIWQPPQFG